MKLIMQCFNGMSYRVAQGDRKECHAAAKRVRERRKAQGYEVQAMSPQSWEITSDGLVDDNQGVLQIAGDSALKREYGS